MSANKQYTLTAIPPQLWAAVKAKAASEEVSVRALLLKWLAEYVQPEGER